MPPTRPLDGAMDLALQLALLRERHDLCVLAVSTLDGRLLASCGDAESSRALAAFAHLVLGRAERDAARTMHCGRMQLERVDLVGEPCVVTAMSESVIDEPEAIAASLRALYGTPADASFDEPEHAADDDWSFEADLLA